MIIKNTEKGQRIYSFGPMPESLKQAIRDNFGDLFDIKFHSVWDVYSLTNPNYIGITVVGCLPVPIPGDLERYYKMHLNLDTSQIDYEVYSYNESSFDLPNDLKNMMANSGIFMASIKTDSEYKPNEWTTYYHKKQCDVDEYAKLRERVEKPHPNGYIIAIKKNNSGYSFEEYGNDK